MNDRKSIVLDLVVIMTALVLLTGCVTNPLAWSISRGNISNVEKHIDEGADVDSKYGLSGDRVLNLAVRSSNPQIVTLLIDAGADINAENGDCQTPLMTAAASGDVEMAGLLVESGANVNISNNCQGVEYSMPATALIAASWYWHSDVAQLLIEAGSDVNFRASDGDTALDWALRWGSAHKSDNHNKMIETAIVLVQGGADGPRALDWAQSYYLRDELAKLLQEVGAPNPDQLAWLGDYSEVAEYLKDWKSEEAIK